MLAFLGLIFPGLLTTINGITNAIANERIKQLDAKTDQDRIASEERQKSLEARRDVLVAEGSNPTSNIFNVCTRLLLALSALLMWFKLGPWDKVFGSWHGCTNTILIDRPSDCYLYRTDTLDPNMWWMMIAVVGFYFVTSTTWFKK